MKYKTRLLNMHSALAKLEINDARSRSAPPVGISLSLFSLSLEASYDMAKEYDREKGAVCEESFSLWK